MLSNILSLKCIMKNSSLILQQSFFGLRNLQIGHNRLRSGFVNGDCIFHRRED
jgi:hypothetical protein